MNARVRLQVATGGKSFTARQTHVTFLVCQKKVISVNGKRGVKKQLTGMYQHVHVDVRLLFELARANVARVLALFVHAPVFVQTARQSKRTRAHFTL